MLDAGGRCRVSREAYVSVSTSLVFRLKRVVIGNGNVFAELMNTVRVCSLGQITKALFEAGGEYRQSM